MSHNIGLPRTGPVAPYPTRRSQGTLPMPHPRFAVIAADIPLAREAEARLATRYDLVAPDEAEVIVALGGDGLMLEVLHHTMGRGTPVYGMNRGSVGFLMNRYSEDDLPARLAVAETVALSPLRMTCRGVNGMEVSAHAINEVSLFRQSRQTAKLKIWIDGRERLAELICDGALVCTSAGSTAYNLSAHGPILPVGANVLALTPISAFRPRRWRGAILPHTARVRFEVLEPDKRGVSAVADFTEVRDALCVEVQEDTNCPVRLMYDPEHNLEERILAEQFTA